MAEPQQATVPDIGDDKDVPVIEILVAVGDAVKKDQGLVTLESDKATMEVPAPFDGIVRELKVKVGDALSAGSLVAMIEPAAAARDVPTPTAASPSGPEPVAVDQAAASRTPTAAAHRDAAAAEAAPAAPAPAPARTGTPPVAFDADALMPGKVPHASPAVRLFARELGVDLAQVTGSARAGRISK